MDDYTPGDYLCPDWAGGGRAHNWKNYISEELRQMWETFTPEQRAALARSAENTASAENWD